MSVPAPIAHVFEDSYCETCRCGPLHHTVDSESVPSAHGFRFRVYCKYHKKLCHDETVDVVMGLQARKRL